MPLVLLYTLMLFVPLTVGDAVPKIESTSSPLRVARMDSKVSLSCFSSAFGERHDASRNKPHGSPGSTLGARPRYCAPLSLASLAPDNSWKLSRSHPRQTQLVLWLDATISHGRFEDSPCPPLPDPTPTRQFARPSVDRGTPTRPCHPLLIEPRATGASRKFDGSKTARWARGFSAGTASRTSDSTAPRERPNSSWPCSGRESPAATQAGGHRIRLRGLDQRFR